MGKVDYKKRMIHVEMSENFKDTLTAWKNECMGRGGKGAIKLRLEKLISEDLKKLVASK